MPSWRKVITSGSDASLSNLVVTGGITGSLQGTASYALSALNASTASYFSGSITNAIFAETASYVLPLRQAVSITGSLNVSGSTTQIGNNTLAGNTTLSGSIIISGSTTNPVTPTIKVFGDMETNGVIKFTPVDKSIDTTISASYIYVSGSTNDLYFSQNGSGFTNFTRLRWLEGNLYTGLLSGGVITSTPGSTTFSISSGSGIIVSLNAFTSSADPFPTIQYITWPTTTQPITNSGSAKITYVGISNVGTVVQQTVPWGSTNIDQWDQQIELGTVLHLSGSVSTGVYNSPQVGYGEAQRTDDFVRSFGPLKISGHVLQPSGSTLSLIKSAGFAYNNGANYINNPNHPSTVSDPAITVSKIYRYHISGSTPVIDTGVAAAGYTVIDPSKYVRTSDGTLQNIPGGQYSIQRVFWFPNSPTNAFIVYYGNDYYNSAANAQLALQTEVFTEAPNTAQNAIFLGSIIISAAETNLQNATIVPAGLFRAVGGIGSTGTTPVATALSSLSDVAITSVTAGDLLTYGGGQWNNSKTLNGTYTINGGLTVTGSLIATASRATSASRADSAVTASYVLNAVTASYSETASYVNPLRQTVLVTGSLIISASGTTNDLQVGTNKLFVSASGNVGIGTTTPTQPLQVRSTTTIGASNLTGSTVLIGTPTSGLGIDANEIATSGSGLVLSTLDNTAIGFRTNKQQHVTISGSGEVGIGITVPTAKLHINNTTPSASFLVEDSTNPDTTPFVIDASGNVAIGTGSAFEKVTIQNGNIALKDSTNSAQTSIVFTPSDNTLRNYITTANSSSALDDYMKVGSWFGSVHLVTGNITGSTTRLYVSRSGEIGVGISSSLNARFHINNTTTQNSFLVEDSANPDSTPFVIDSAGDVSIGSTSSYAPYGTITKSKLDIYSGNSSVPLTIRRDDATGDHMVFVKNDTGAQWWVALTNDDFRLYNLTGSDNILFGVDGGTNDRGNKVGIGVGVPTARLHVNNTSTSASFLVEDSTNPDSTPFVIDAAGNVGIGKTTPTAKLDVIGDALISGSLTVTSVINANLTGSLFGTASWAVSASNVAATSNAFIQGGNSFGTTATLGTNDTQNLNFETSGSVRMSISSSGNVGIGTTSPPNKLTIQDTVGDSLRVYIPDDTKFNRILFQKPSQTWSVGAINTNDFVIADENAVTYRLRIQSGSSNFQINSNGTGSVSIGTTATSASLHVNNTGAGNSFLVEDSANPDTSPFVIDNSGAVAIGQTSSLSGIKLTVNGNTLLNNHYLFWNYDGASNNDYIVSNDSPHGGTGNTPGFYVFKHDSTLSVASGSGNSTLDAGSIWMNGSTQTNYIAGNVGIGTTTPNARLDISGSTIITGSLTVTQGITGSLFGTASWAQNAVTSSYVLNAVSSSFASTASFLNTLNQDLTFNGNLTLNGTASISYLNVLVESASVIYSSGSNQLGDATNDTQTLIGTTVLSGSLQLTGSANLPSITGSLLGTASYAVNADTASVANLALSVGTLNQVLIVSGSSNNGTSLVRITQTGAGNAFLVEDEANVDSTPFVIDTTGNVGIGTLTPTAKLDVVGNANISGSLSVTGVVNANLTGSVFGTSSWAQNAVTASYIVTAQTASYVLNSVSSSFASTSQNANTASFVTTAQTASYVLNAVSASFATSASRSVSSSFATTAQTASYILNAVSASFATTSQTASYVLNAVTASFVTLSQTASFVTTAQTASYVLNAVSSSFTSTSSFVNTLNQNVLITGSLTIGSGSLGPSENTLTLGPRDNVQEGGQLGFAAAGGTYTSASFIDLYQNRLRILRGTNAGSDAEVAAWNMHTKQMQLPAYNSAAAFPGTSVANLAVDSSGNIITIATGTVTSASFASTASFVNTLNQNVIITGSVAVTQNITASAFATTNALITSTATTINSGITTIYNIPTASYDGAWFDYTIRSGSNARAGSIMGIWTGTAVNYTETTTTDFGNTSGFALGMSVVGANMILSSSATTSGWSFNAIVRSV